MPQGHIYFAPKPGVDPETFGDAVSWYAACLWKGGQISENYVLSRSGRGWRLAVHFYGLNASAMRAHATYARTAFKLARDLCRTQPKWNIAPPGPDAADRIAHWVNAPSLIMCPTPTPGIMPCGGLLHGDSMLRVPFWTLPISDRAKEITTRWCGLSGCLHNLWYYTGPLELAALNQLVDVHRQVIDSGRSICARIEAATQRPVYLDVFRHTALRHGEDKRPCPGCGRKWARRVTQDLGLGRYEFRCERCRLVQLRGINDTVVSGTRFGEWRNGPAIPSASSLVRQFRTDPERE